MKPRQDHSIKLLQRWIDGSITSREEAELDRLAQDDPWLADALAGYRAEAGTDHKANLDQLRKKLSTNSDKKRMILPVYWQVAAAIVLLLGVAWWLQPGLMDTSVPESMATIEQAEERTLNRIDEKLEQEVPMADIQVIDEQLADNTPILTKPNSPLSTPELEPNVTFSAPSNSNLSVSSNTDVVEQEEEPSTEALSGIAAATHSGASKTIDPSPAAVAVEGADDAIAEAEKDVATPTLVEDTPAAFDTAPTAAPSRNEEVAKRRAQYPIQAELSQREMITNIGQPIAKPGFRIVEGRVTDAQGYPLIGANLLELGSTNGVVTDIEGNFRIVVPEGLAELSVSYTGYSSLAVDVAAEQEHLTITLPEGDTLLDEVVVTGLGVNTNRQAQDEEIVVKPMGGYRQLRQYIRQSTPDGTETGRVKLRFTVQASGRPYNIQIIKSAGAELDALARRLLQNGPNWNILSGQTPVTVEYTMRFR